MFNKRAQEPEKPRILGEDFDIFPDLSGKPKAPVKQEEAPEAEEEEPLEPTPFQKRIAAYTEEKWKRLQILFGIVLGLIASLSITFLSKIAAFSNWGLVIAAVVALLIPSQVEKRGGRKMSKLRVTLIITLVTVFAVYIFYGLVLNPGYFELPAE